jgi:1,5-anhydro-D-fructose reductase (1,5-anhydro-D-mannitol-forming)
VASLKGVRWGIIGCGDVTEVKSGPAFQKAERSSLVAVMRRDQAKAEDFARRHGVPRWYGDAGRLITDPEVDAIYIATPPSSHKRYVMMAAEMKKPVYVEKPMAIDHAECRDMVAACDRAGIPLFVAYYRRAMPRFAKVKELLVERAIGDLRLVTVSLRQPPSPADLDHQSPSWRVQPAIAGGGLFMDLACHTLDLLDYYLGPVVFAAGGASNQGGLYDAEDIVTAHFRFQSGVHGTGAWCFTSADRHDRVEIVGNRGTIAFSTFENAPVELIRDGRLERFEIPHPPHVQQPLIQTVVDALTGHGLCPSTGTTAARTSWVMDQMLESYRRRHATG